MVPGLFVFAGCQRFNRRRLLRDGYKNIEKNKLRRKILRGKTAARSDKNKENEKKSYSSGGF